MPKSGIMPAQGGTNGIGGARWRVRTSAGHKGEAMIPSDRISLVGLALLALVPAACGTEGKSEGELKADIVSSMHELMLTELQGLYQAALDLQSAAPPALSSGWDPSKDSGAAIDAMKEAWSRTRLHWERAEGPVAPMFGDLDDAIDSRYDEMLAALPAGDSDPFDGQGIVGMHAIERILYAPGPLAVANDEMNLPNSLLAVWPTSDAQAAEFKNGICQRLVSDTQSLLNQWKTKTIDLSTVFTGLIGLISSQAEKVGLAAMNLEESRYSQTTMADLRSNLAGTRAVYNLFGPLLATKPYGTTLDTSAMDSFDRLGQTYQNVSAPVLLSTR
jgi:iron uptake system component EfeO